MAKSLELLGMAVRRILASRGLSQQWLADKAGIPQPNLNKYLTGKTMPGVEMIDRIADALGVAPATLLSEAPIKPEHRPNRQPRRQDGGTDADEAEEKEAFTARPLLRDRAGEGHAKDHGKGRGRGMDSDSPESVSVHHSSLSRILAILSTLNEDQARKLLADLELAYGPTASAGDDASLLKPHKKVR